MTTNKLCQALKLTAVVASMAIIGTTHAEMNKQMTKDGTESIETLAPKEEANRLVVKAAEAVREFKTSKVSEKFYSSIVNGRAVLVVPEYERAGLALGGEGGKGVLLKKTRVLGEWSYPAFFGMSGATFGPQAGFEKGALIVVIHDEQTLNEIMNGELTLAAEARAVIGTKGVQAQTAKTGGNNIDVFIRSKGAFAGAIVKGGEVKPLEGLNHAFYGRKVSTADIFKPAGPINPKADELRLALAELARKPLTTPTN